MTGVFDAIGSFLRRNSLPTTTFDGSNGTAWFAGFERRAPSIAEFFCGDDVGSGASGRVWRRRIPGRIADIAGNGGLAVLRLPDRDPRLIDVLAPAIAVPPLVGIHTNLPADVEELRSQLLTSTTKEDFRRIRKANFTYRITQDREATREFHGRYYAPLLRAQFPVDGHVAPVERVLRRLDEGGELICADIDGEWVAGILNIPRDTHYELRTLGIRDGDNEIRQKRAVAALIIRSLERAVELGRDRATLGRSLPFLGKGPVWFKAKWDGVLTLDPADDPMHIFMDLRNESVRGMLSSSPIIHIEDDELVVSAWLEPGEKPLKALVRDAGRFPGIARWYVLAEPDTLAEGESELSSRERIVTVPISPEGDAPVWLGEVLARRAVSV